MDASARKNSGHPRAGASAEGTQQAGRYEESKHSDLQKEKAERYEEKESSFDAFGISVK